MLTGGPVFLSLHQRMLLISTAVRVEYLISEFNLCNVCIWSVFHEQHTIELSEYIISWSPFRPVFYYIHLVRDRLLDHVESQLNKVELTECNFCCEGSLNQNNQSNEVVNDVVKQCEIMGVVFFIVRVPSHLTHLVQTFRYFSLTWTKIVGAKHDRTLERLFNCFRRGHTKTGEQRRLEENAVAVQRSQRH